MKQTGTGMLLAAVPGAITATMDSSHHMIPFQRPDELARLIANFLTERVER